jgi:hypothetical protein
VSPSVVAPTSAEPGVSAPPPSPSSQWNEEEQGAVDAVQRSLKVWAEIGRDPGGTDWSLMTPVAMEPALQGDKDGWAEWVAEGWHVEGTPEFEATDSSLGLTDSDGKQYHVVGCMRLRGFDVVDSDGESVYPDANEETLFSYQVLLKPSGQYFVMKDLILEASC